MSILTKPYFHDEGAAFAKLESIVWPDGPVCPKCGNKHSEKKIYDLKGVRSKPSKKNPDGVVRHGLKKCGACRKQFTVRVGTIFESSHAPLHLWFQAVHLMCSSKKGISSHQLHRILEVQYNTAWFMAHRIREAMRSGELAPMGGGGKVVEVDETYTGRRKNRKYSKGFGHKWPVLSLVERGGEVRSFNPQRADMLCIMPIVRANIDKETAICTDSGRHYNQFAATFASHDTVNHTKDEYVRYERHMTVHSNTVEGYFSIFKKGMKAVYQHCSEKHLHRYLAEFDFRYNNRTKLGVEDPERTENALRGIIGKRLTYRSANEEVTH